VCGNTAGLLSLQPRGRVRVSREESKAPVRDYWVRAREGVRRVQGVLKTVRAAILSAAKTTQRMCELRRRHVRGERGFLASLIQDTNRPVVEVGTGACACLTLVLGASGFLTLAIDRDPDAAARARRLIAKTGLLRLATVAEADAAALPLRPKSVRTVVAYDALHHAPALRASIAEIARALHRQGRLIVSDRDEAKDGFLERLGRALRGHFHKVTVVPRRGRRVYICEDPQRPVRAAKGPPRPRSSSKTVRGR